MARSFFYCGIAYAVALAAAVAVANVLQGLHPLWVALAADVVATAVVFGFSFAFDNSSFYDPYWSVAPVPLAVYFALQPLASDEFPSPRALLALLLVAAWAARLTYNFLRGWGGLDHEDWRYVDIRLKTGRAYWLVSFLGIHLFPTLMVFAGCLPLYAAFERGARPLNLLDGLATVVTLTAIAIEAIADAQLRSFRLRSDRKPEEILDGGLWAWSRHPNYFGEMLFWWGLWLFALAAGPGNRWTVAGAAAITLMFHVVSLRLLETRMLERRPEYAAHVRRVPAFLPYRWPRKQRAA
jgi:steroid 5-alpha reductase family enzyme